MAHFDSFPEQIKTAVGNLTYTVDTLGRSGDAVYNFENKLILKVSSAIEMLHNEYRKNDWITGIVPGPKSVLFVTDNSRAYYLRECLNGDNLISERFIQNPPLLIDTLKKVQNVLLTLSAHPCPFRSSSCVGNEFIHGDLCLPNIYVDENNDFIGFIDVNDAGLGDSFFDYAWVIWSFEYNIHTSAYTAMLKQALHIPFDTEKYKSYVLDAFN